jgi:hypothetical protein
MVGPEFSPSAGWKVCRRLAGVVRVEGAGSRWERWGEDGEWLRQGEGGCQVDSMFEGEGLILVELDSSNRSSCVDSH